MEKYRTYPAVLKRWYYEKHSTDPQELVEYVYDILKAAYRRDIPISVKVLSDRSETVVHGNSDKTYDMYEFTVNLIDNGSFYTYLDDVKFIYRSCKKANSTRSSVEGVYHLYLGKTYYSQTMDLNCSYYDVTDEYQQKNLNYRIAVRWLVRKILADNMLNTWLILQGINVRNIL